MQIRENCLICGSINTVLITIQNGKKKWKCFEAGCQNFGVQNVGLDAEYVTWQEKTGYIDKGNLVSIHNRPDVLEYLAPFHCIQSNTNIYYDLKKDRIVFNYKDLYTGRALDSKVQPKWYHYTNTDYPFIIQVNSKQKTKGVLLVEDPISACTASFVIDSIALLGTNLKDKYLPYILDYEIIHIALDEDATTSALKIFTTLSTVRQCKIIQLKKDIKYMNWLEIETLL